MIKFHFRFQEAIERDDGNYEYHLDLAVCLWESGERQKECFHALLKVKNSFLSCAIWSMSWDYGTFHYAICEQQIRRSACASAQSDQCLFVRCLYNIIPLVSISKISSLYLASVAAQAGLCLTWSQTLKTGFLVMGLISLPLSKIDFYT